MSLCCLRLLANKSRDGVTKSLPTRGEDLLTIVYELCAVRSVHVRRQLSRESLGQVIERRRGWPKYRDTPGVHRLAAVAKTPAPKRRNQPCLNERRLAAAGVSDNGKRGGPAEASQQLLSVA